MSDLQNCAKFVTTILAKSGSQGAVTEFTKLLDKETRELTFKTTKVKQKHTKLNAC